MSKNKFSVMAFQEQGDGSLTDIVGRKSLFKDKEDFLNYCLNEDEGFANHFEGEETEFTVNDIKEDYIRYYPHFPEDMSMGIESGYTFCKKAKGAIEVYVLNLD